PVLIIELVAVAMPLVDFQAPVSLMGLTSLEQHTRVRAEPHRAAHFHNVILLIEQANDRMATMLIDLGRIGVFQAHHIAGELHNTTLQTEADAEKRDASVPRVT